jgi:hypothetical protein
MLLRLSAVLFAGLSTCPVTHAQESVRDLTGAQNSKFLTPNQLDRWLFEGEKGETIIAHVASKDFDPILGIARADVKDDKPFLDVDDPGSESRFAFRLPDKGKFEIRVNAVKFQGGGNYTLRVQRFQASPLSIGKPLVATLDHDGKGYHYFPGVKDRILVPEVLGASAEQWKVLDSKGREAKKWAGTAYVETDGEGYVVVSGQPNQRYDLVVREAKRHDLVEGKEQPGTLLRGEMDNWSFQGKPGDFRFYEIEKTGEVQARLVFAPADTSAEQRLSQDERPEIEFLPVASRSGKLRIVAILGREGRYQLQLVAASSTTYRLTTRDSSVPLAIGKAGAGELPVGGAVFYRFQATAGQLLQMALTSQKFVPQLRLYDVHGTLLADSGNNPDTQTAHITHMVVSGGMYRLQVASVGDGGGGEFRQELNEATVEELKLGDRGKGTLGAGETDFRVFDAKEGQTVFLSVRSPSFDPAVSIRGPDGVLLVAENRGTAGTGSLLAIKLPKAGRYVVWIGSRRGAGGYTVRLIDGD